MNEDVSFTINAVAFKQGNGAKAGGIGYREEQAPTLAASPSGTNQVPAVAVDCRNGVENEFVNGTLQAKSNGGRTSTQTMSCGRLLLILNDQGGRA